MSPFRKKRKPYSAPKTKLEVVSEYVQALGSAIILAVVIRGFLFEPFKIPSESMVPTLLVGDHIFVKRFAYGLRIPGTKIWPVEFEDPKRGDVIVFSYPEDESIDFIKRVVGLPGDKITFINGDLFINDQKVPNETFALDGVDPDNKRKMRLNPAAEAIVPDDLKPFPYYYSVNGFEHEVEEFSDTKNRHYTQRSLELPFQTNGEWIVPPRHFFVLGDNRDQSQDSRFWKFVPRENLKGRAIFIWLSLDNDRGWVRWYRFGRGL